MSRARKGPADRSNRSREASAAGGALPSDGVVADALSAPACRRRHLRAGWWAVFVYLAMGLVLESLHGFKAAFYVDAANETRRLMWTLGHAHGTLLGLINVAFGLWVGQMRSWSPTTRTVASWCLLASLLLLPLGFILGGVKTYAGDPSVGVALVPLGGVLLLAGAFLTARAASLEPVE